MATSVAGLRADAVPSTAGEPGRAERWRAHEARKVLLAQAMRAAAGPPRLAKDTTNLFRDRAAAPRARLDVRDLVHVLDVDRSAGRVDVEAMCPYADIVDATLPAGVMPAVVPELRSITIGGAAAGIGIESSSFRYGLAHETLEEIEILLPDGETVIARPDNAHADLFFGFPNSYGTLGYALRLVARTVAVKPFARIEHRRLVDASAYYAALEEACAAPGHDFVEGVVFGAGDLALSTAGFVDTAPYTSDYGLERIYWRSIRERAEDFLTTRDYIWRWDTDWFWCSRVMLAQNPLVRRLLGRKRLSSVFYMRVMRQVGRTGVLPRLYGALGYRSEAVIQDVAIPIRHAPEFLAFLLREIGILPIWNCPVRAFDPSRRYSLFPLEPGTLYVNFGFWDSVRRRESRPEGWYNRRIEAEVERLGGVKSLYSDACYTQDEFWSVHDRAAYDRLKATYDPHRRLPDLYQKCVLRQ